MENEDKEKIRNCMLPSSTKLTSSSSFYYSGVSVSDSLLRKCVSLKQVLLHTEVS